MTYEESAKTIVGARNLNLLVHVYRRLTEPFSSYGDGVSTLSTPSTNNGHLLFYAVVITVNVIKNVNDHPVRDATRRYAPDGQIWPRESQAAASSNRYEFI